MRRFVFAGSKTNEISFPLGGLGAGCIGLAGNGRLIDWEILNRPDKGSLNGFSHFAVKAERDGQLLDARILQGDLHPPYSGERGMRMFSGFGWGPRRENLCGMPHFRQHVFDGRFPFASISFSGEEQFPGEPVLLAWSPFIPGDDRASGLPGAFFEIETANTAHAATDFTVVGALSNPFGRMNSLHRVTSANAFHQLTLTNTATATDDPSYGDLTLSTDAQDISFQSNWYRGEWCDDLEIYWRDFTRPGRFAERSYGPGIQGGWTARDTGHLAAHFQLQPGERRCVRFAITWNVPNCVNYWRGPELAKRIADAGLSNRWKNWYATQWRDSRDSGRYALENWHVLRQQSEVFQRALFGSSLPEVAIDAVAANLSILKSPTCMRLEDGTFYGWEGAGADRGCCEGACAHVWNYAQALPFLFPRLERSMRTANYTYNVDEAGGSHFRLMLPLGIKAQVSDFRPCADGQFGDVIKTYRDWKICGDTAWLRRLWPSIRSTIEYAWSKDNPDQWDPNKTGVLHGRQHHTLDMELFGPNAWLTGYYLAALKAAAEMAPACGDPDFGVECQRLFRKGKEWADSNLFNGEYYGQQLDLTDRRILEEFDAGGDAITGGKASNAYWSQEHGQIKYQVGQGCEIDMTIAQWHASLYGLGEIFDPRQVRSTLEAVYRHNFKTARDEANPWRVYALNDEAGLVICTWPPGRERPAIPLPYAQEVQTGYVYAAATGMIQAGLLEEGVTVIRSVRDRFDGEKRNPWNEIECGSNYARSMASYSLLNAFSGFQFDLVNGFIGFAPITQLPSPGSHPDLVFFWSLDGAWGLVRYRASQVELSILCGKLALQSCDFAVAASRVTIDGEVVPLSQQRTRITFPEVRAVRESLVVTIR